jgi:hypothetical protein
MILVHYETFSYKKGYYTTAQYGENRVKFVL